VGALENWQQDFLYSLGGDEDGFALNAFESLSEGRHPEKLASLLDNVVGLTLHWDLRTGAVEFKGGKRWKVGQSTQFGLSRRELARFEKQVGKIEEKIRRFLSSRFATGDLAQMRYSGDPAKRALANELDRLPEALAGFRKFVGSVRTPRREEKEAHQALVNVFDFLDADGKPYSLEKLAGVLNRLYKSRLSSLNSKVARKPGAKAPKDERFETPKLKNYQREARQHRARVPPVT
jgi:hypothetical protein